MSPEPRRTPSIASPRWEPVPLEEAPPETAAYEAEMVQLLIKRGKIS